MPRIDKIFSLQITPEQYLNNCSPDELQELALLLNGSYYQNRMKNTQHFKKVGAAPFHSVEKNSISRAAENQKNIDLFNNMSIVSLPFSTRLNNRLYQFFLDIGGYQSFDWANCKVKDLYNFDLNEFSKIRGNGTGGTYNELKKFLDENKIPYKI